MGTVRHRRRDLIQNISIVLLSLSAVALFLQTQLVARPDGQDGYLDRLGASSTSAADGAVTDLRALAAPVRVAVSGAYGRYGDISLSTTDDAFSSGSSSPGMLLASALGTAQQRTVSDGTQFLAALSRPSIYYDFLSPLPLSILADLVGAELEDDTAFRRLVLSVGEDQGVRLYLWDGGASFAQCDVGLSAAQLEQAVSTYELGNAFFAFDRADQWEDRDAVEACSLFLEGDLPNFPTLTAVSALTDSSSLLASMGFNPSTKFRYTESSGTEVISDGDRTLRIRTDGTVFYQSGGDPALTIAASGEVPTIIEAAVGCTGLVSQLSSGMIGDAFFYLESVQQTGNTFIIRYGLQIGGVPIRLSSNYAAEVILTGTTVSSMMLTLRQYTASADTSLLLPLRQALAIAALDPGRELSIGYADSGAASVSAVWLLD